MEFTAPPETIGGKLSIPAPEPASAWLAVIAIKEKTTRGGADDDFSCLQIPIIIQTLNELSQMICFFNEQARRLERRRPATISVQNKIAPAPATLAWRPCRNFRWTVVALRYLRPKRTFGLHHRHQRDERVLIMICAKKSSAFNAHLKNFRPGQTRWRIIRR